MRLVLHIIGRRIDHSMAHILWSRLVKSQLHQESEPFQLVDRRYHRLHMLVQALRDQPSLSGV